MDLGFFLLNLLVIASRPKISLTLASANLPTLSSVGSSTSDVMMNSIATDLITGPTALASEFSSGPGLTPAFVLIEVS